ncbi:hypothetical protein MLD38_006535 [Melastoma candidum]|uniref:Uncharacterized protein n=1 Tax=Melastoma candidum TaxID=119954 RepID=A0ACB9RNB6_9MYRT|nr:hypothetical protein MLD38_006535 [Melastoma candidum]
MSPTPDPTRHRRPSRSFGQEMPLKWVLQWQPNPGNTVNNQILNEVSQCVETIHGVKEGRWKATLTYYKPILRDQTNAAEFPRDFIGMSLSEQPNKCYFTLRSHRIVVETDMSVQNIMEKLQSYKSRVALIFEGSQYQLGDFQLRVGKVIPSHSENLRGIVMEIEYLPLSSLEKSRQVMEDFIDIWQDVLSKSRPVRHCYGPTDRVSTSGTQHEKLRFSFILHRQLSFRVVKARGS